MVIKSQLFIFVVASSAFLLDFFASARSSLSYNGDSTTDFALYIPGELDARWLINLNYLGGWDWFFHTTSIGGRGEIPLAGDFNGDGWADIGLYIPSATGARWVAVSNLRNGTFSTRFLFDFTSIGGFGELPIIGDFDGDGYADLGVYIPRMRDARWVAIRNDRDSTFSSNYMFDLITFGGAGETPLVGDFDGDGRDDIGLYVPRSTNAVWLVKRNTGEGSFSFNNYISATTIGGPGEFPLVGDYNGDGWADIGVYIPGARSARWVVVLNLGTQRFSSTYWRDFTKQGRFCEFPVTATFSATANISACPIC